MRVCVTRIVIAASLGVVSCGKGNDTTALQLDEPGAANSPGTLGDPGSTAEAAPEPQAPPGFAGELANVAASSVLSGFEHGQLRKRMDVAGFSISKRPITLAQYQSCVAAQVCQAPQQECANAGGSGQDAALCVGEENARAYCAWGEGRLPSLEEWLLAARGASPQRFSWGDAAATCEQHPLALDPTLQRLSNAPGSAQVPTETKCGAPVAARFEVGKHAAGASPSGVEDVLLARGELLGGEPASHFTPCAMSGRSCLVYGVLPGAIDAVKLVNEAGTAEMSEAYTFRCVWSKGGS